MLEELNSSTHNLQGDLLRIQLEMFDKLVLAITNVVKDYQPAKKLIL